MIGYLLWRSVTAPSQWRLSKEVRRWQVVAFALRQIGLQCRVTFKQALKMAQTLGDVEESTSYGTPAIKIGGQLVARLKEDGDSLVVGITYEERAEIMAAEPEIYYITDHYLTAPWVLVRLSKVPPDALRDLLGGAMRLASAEAKKKAPRRRK